MAKHLSLFQTLRSLEGNTKACVYTEPLWGIPAHLFMPYASLYMLQLGLIDRQIGFIASAGMVLQILFALLGGAITDKLGRKRTTFLFDLMAWSVPMLILTFAQNYYYFLAASLIGSTLRVTMNSWNCLLVEDGRSEQLIHVYSWVYIAGIISGFVAPLAGLLVSRFSLIPAVRGMYFFAFLSMTAKFIILNIMATETRQGIIRMEQTRHQSIFTILKQYRGILGMIIHNRYILSALVLYLIYNVTGTIRNIFWSIWVTEGLLIPEEAIAIFPALKSVVMLLFYFIIIPRLRGIIFKIPMSAGFLGAVIANILLIMAPQSSYLILIISAIIDAVALALVQPFIDTMLVDAIDKQERARITSIVHVVIIGLSSPFGWIGGILSGMNKMYPFLLSTVLLMAGLAVILNTKEIRTRQA